MGTLKARTYSVGFHIVLGIGCLVMALSGMYFYLQDGSMMSHDESLALLIGGIVGLVISASSSWAYANDAQVMIIILTVIQFGIFISLIVFLSLFSSSVHGLTTNSGSKHSSMLLDFTLSVYQTCCVANKKICLTEIPNETGFCESVSRCTNTTQKNDLDRACFAHGNNQASNKPSFVVGSALCRYATSQGLVGKFASHSDYETVEEDLCGQGNPRQFVQQFVEFLSGVFEPRLNGFVSVLIIGLLIQVVCSILLLGIFVPSKKDLHRSVSSVAERVKSMSMRTGSRSSKNFSSPNSKSTEVKSHDLQPVELGRSQGKEWTHQSSKDGDDSQVKGSQVFEIPMDDINSVDDILQLSQLSRENSSIPKPTITRQLTTEKPAHSRAHSVDTTKSSRGRTISKDDVVQKYTSRPHSLDSRSRGSSRSVSKGTQSMVRFDSRASMKGELPRGVSLQSNPAEESRSVNPRDRVISVGSLASHASVDSLVELTLEHYKRCAASNPSLVQNEGDIEQGFNNQEDLDEDDPPLYLSMDYFDRERSRTEGASLDDHVGAGEYQRSGYSSELPRKPPTLRQASNASISSQRSRASMFGMHRENSTRSNFSAHTVDSDTQKKKRVSLFPGSFFSPKKKDIES